MISHYRFAVGVFGAAVGLSLASGCSLYYSGYEFSPRPARVEAHYRDDQTAGVETLVSVLGIRRADPEVGYPVRVEVRMRLTNDSEAVVTLQPETMVLLSADLQRFPSSFVNAQDVVTLAPGESVGLTGHFPLPENKHPRHIDLESLHLSWQIQIGDQAISQSTTLHRDRYRDSHDAHAYPWRSYPFRHTRFRRQVPCD